MSKQTGGCHCGAVKFETDLDPMFVSQCNCSRCRRIWGLAGVYAFYADSEVTFSGETSIYQTPGGSEMPLRYHFCGNCACKVYAFAEAFPGIVVLSLGAFDDPHQFKPRMEIFTNYKLEWLTDDGCIEDRFEEEAVEERLNAILETLAER